MIGMYLSSKSEKMLLYKLAPDRDDLSCILVMLSLKMKVD